MADPEQLVKGARVCLPGDDDVVTLVQVTQGVFWEIVYRGSDGSLGEVTLPEAEVPEIKLMSSAGPVRFRGDPRRFRLGVEALRIESMFRHDMAALAVSNISPLPHQLDAVYGSLLPEPVLRFLLADDPGAGKTIMAGLYIKELMLRHAADRVLIVTPANLRPQWQRELAERFDIHCTQFDSAMLHAHPTQNPWDQHDLVVVSRDLLRREEVMEGFAGAEREWDLAIIDEAHGFTLDVDSKGLIKKRSERYKAAEVVARKAHRLILLTATPHSGRNESMWGLLRLLDPDAYGDRCPSGDVPLNPHQYRKVAKEEMVDMRGEALFKPRHPHTVAYDLEGTERDLYEAVTDLVSTELARIRGESGPRVAGFALTTMQRRLASSLRAIKRTLERRVNRLAQALEDPATYLRSRQEFISDVYGEQHPDELGDLNEDERWEMEERALDEWLPGTITELEEELTALRPLLIQAEEAEAAGTEVKLNELLEVVRQEGLSDDPSVKLLIFTEHRDTLHYLVEKLSPDFEVVSIHGGMRLGDRIAAERDFRERAQVMVATEAAGEGINLQFCHLMVNYDIPWNPNRLEQRMGRIHRIGQTRDVHIYNMVAANTLEGHVLATLLQKLENMGRVLGDKVFDVIGETFAGYRLAELIEQVLAKEISPDDAAESIGGDQADPETEARFRELTKEALATRYVDWQSQAEAAARAAERRLPPGYIEKFFTDAVAFLGGKVEDRLDPGTLRVTRTPDELVAVSRAAGATREVYPSYERITFDKAVRLRAHTSGGEHAVPEAELCGPGHPLFDAALNTVIVRTRADVEAGAVFAAPDVDAPTVLFFLTGDCMDGTGEMVHRAFATVAEPQGQALRPSRELLYDMFFHDAEAPEVTLSDVDKVVNWARQHEFEPHFQQASTERTRVVRITEDYLTKAFAEIAARQQTTLLDLDAEVERGVAGAEGRRRQAELAAAETTAKRDERLDKTRRSRNVKRGPVRIIATALVVPSLTVGDDRPIDTTGKFSSREIEQIAVRAATRYETDVRGADIVRSFEAQKIGFDLLSLTGIDRRCIEVKGRAGVGGVELTWSEFAKALELGEDYWLYVVLDCATPNPRLYRVQDPAKVLASAWSSKLDVRYRVAPQPVIDAAEAQP